MQRLSSAVCGPPGFGGLRREVAMKLVCTLLFLGLAMMAYAQSQTQEQPQTQQQTNEQSPPPQKTTVQVQSPVQVQTPRAKVPPPPPPRPIPFFRWELTGGYAHISGNEGLNGFNVGGSVFLAPKVSLGFNYDGVYDTTVLGTFALTNVGLTTSKSHLQDFMAGGRFFFPGVLKIHCGTKEVVPFLQPFLQAQFGESNLWSQVTSVNVGTISSSDTTFSWLLGGGGDIRVSDHFSARVSTDLLRTHFADEGQSRIRIILGVVGRF